MSAGPAIEVWPHDPMETLPPLPSATPAGVHAESRPQAQLAAVATPRTARQAWHAQERPDGADGRVVPLLNGLGSLTAEELFVVYRRCATLLADAGIEIVDPHVGDYCTSFDMAGASLTLFWLDDELAQSAWLMGDVDLDIVFDTAPGAMWESAIRRLGADPSALTTSHGVH